MGKVILFGTDTCFDQTIKDLINQENKYHCEFHHRNKIFSLKDNDTSDTKDIVIVDLTMDHDASLDLIRAIKTYYPNAPLMAIHYLKTSWFKRDLRHAGVDVILDDTMTDKDLFHSLNILSDKH